MEKIMLVPMVKQPPENNPAAKLPLRCETNTDDINNPDPSAESMNPARLFCLKKVYSCKASGDSSKSFRFHFVCPLFSGSKNLFFE